MKVGLVVYSDMTEVEVVCVHECLAKVWQLDFPNPPENHLIGVTPEVIGWNGIVIRPHHHFPEVDLAGYDLLVVPGGWASRIVRYNRRFIDWLRTWDPAKPIATCCSGALIVGEAGFLEGRRATIHCLGMKALEGYAADVVKERVVEDGNVITAGGIMAAYDLGLHLVEKFWGAEARRAVAHQDEYRDLEADAEARALLPRLDSWYRGGHLAANRRPADWFKPSPYE